MPFPKLRDLETHLSYCQFLASIGSFNSGHRLVQSLIYSLLRNQCPYIWVILTVAILGVSKQLEAPFASHKDSRFYWDPYSAPCSWKQPYLISPLLNLQQSILFEGKRSLGQGVGFQGLRVLRVYGSYIQHSTPRFRTRRWRRIPLQNSGGKEGTLVPTLSPHCPSRRVIW